MVQDKIFELRKKSKKNEQEMNRSNSGLTAYKCLRECAYGCVGISNGYHCYRLSLIAENKMKTIEPVRFVRWMNFNKLIDLEFGAKRLWQSFLLNCVAFVADDILVHTLYTCSTHSVAISLSYVNLNHAEHQRKLFTIQTYAWAASIQMTINTHHQVQTETLPSLHLHHLNTDYFGWKRKNFIPVDNLQRFLFGFGV